MADEDTTQEVKVEDMTPEQRYTVTDCDGVSKDLRALVTKIHSKDFVIRSFGKKVAYIENARHGFKIDLKTGKALS